MAQSQLALFNLAIAATGTGYTLAATDEDSVPAAMCSLIYENVRQSMLRAAHWNCAKRFARLVEDVERDTAAAWVSGDPEPGYAFSYTAPANLLYARYLTDLSEFVVSDDGTDKIISCNVGGAAATDAPVLCYTIDVTDPTRWEPDLYQGIWYMLAAHLSLPLTGKVTRARELFDLANNLVLTARANTANEMLRLVQSVPQVMQLRGNYFPTVTPFIYPYGAMLVPSGAPVV